MCAVQSPAEYKALEADAAQGNGGVDYLTTGEADKYAAYTAYALTRL